MKEKQSITPEERMEELSPAQRQKVKKITQRLKLRHGLDPTIRKPQTIAKTVDGKLQRRRMSKEQTEQRYIDAEKKHPIRYITYDFLSDAAYIYLIKPENWPDPETIETATIHDGINADFHGSRILGLEILWVSDHLKKFLDKYGKKHPRKRYNILRS